VAGCEWSEGELEARLPERIARGTMPRRDIFGLAALARAG
jgi:hypothetical protein